MTPEQKTWMADHPKFKEWSPHGIVSIMGWTDVGMLKPQGKFVAGEPTWHYWRGVGAKPLASIGDTLYADPSGLMKVGREYMIC